MGSISNGTARRAAFIAEAKGQADAESRRKRQCGEVEDPCSCRACVRRAPARFVVEMPFVQKPGRLRKLAMILQSAWIELDCAVGIRLRRI